MPPSLRPSNKILCGEIRCQLFILKSSFSVSSIFFMVYSLPESEYFVSGVLSVVFPFHWPTYCSTGSEGGRLVSLQEESEKARAQSAAINRCFIVIWFLDGLVKLCRNVRKNGFVFQKTFTYYFSKKSEKLVIKPLTFNR